MFGTVGFATQSHMLQVRARCFYHMMRKPQLSDSYGCAPATASWMTVADHRESRQSGTVSGDGGSLPRRKRPNKVGRVIGSAAMRVRDGANVSGKAGPHLSPFEPFSRKGLVACRAEYTRVDGKVNDRRLRPGGVDTGKTSLQQASRTPGTPRTRPVILVSTIPETLETVRLGPAPGVCNRQLLCLPRKRKSPRGDYFKVRGRPMARDPCLAVGVGVQSHEAPAANRDGEPRGCKSGEINGGPPPFRPLATRDPATRRPFLIPYDTIASGPDGSTWSRGRPAASR
jgi:hypothetical protein